MCIFLKFLFKPDPEMRQNHLYLNWSPFLKPLLPFDRIRRTILPHFNWPSLLTVETIFINLSVFLPFLLKYASCFINIWNGLADTLHDKVSFLPEWLDTANNIGLVPMAWRCSSFLRQSLIDVWSAYMVCTPGRTVVLSNSDRIFWPQEIIPHLIFHSSVRCDLQCFPIFGVKSERRGR